MLAALRDNRGDSLVGSLATRLCEEPRDIADSTPNADCSSCVRASRVNSPPARILVFLSRTKLPLAFQPNAKARRERRTAVSCPSCGNGTVS
jgi:hypothetical protein